MKAERLAQAMARDFRQAAEELRVAAPEELGELVSQIQHRLTTALARFPMERVAGVLVEMQQAEAVDEGMRKELVAGLEMAAIEIEGRS